MTRRLISYSASRSNRDWTTRPYQLDRYSSEYGRTVLHRTESWAESIGAVLGGVALVAIGTFVLAVLS